MNFQISLIVDKIEGYVRYKDALCGGGFPREKYTKFPAVKQACTKNQACTGFYSDCKRKEFYLCYSSFLHPVALRMQKYTISNCGGSLFLKDGKLL